MWLRSLHSPLQTTNEPQPTKRIVATYDYCGADGDLRFQEVRYSPKDFKQRRPDGRGGWIWNLKGVELVLYSLPALMAADRKEPVYIVEGPKDADRLIAGGLAATTNPMGAKKWRSEYNAALRDRHVVILGDNDRDGRDHVQRVARSLVGTAASIKVVEFLDLPDGGDISDWLDAGHTSDDLKELVQQTPLFTEERNEQRNSKTPTILSDYRTAGAAIEQKTFPRTDAGNAELFAHLYGDRLRYDHSRGRWLLWADHHWQPDPDQEVRRLAKDAARWRYGKASGITDLDERKRESAWAISSEQRSRLDATLSLAQAERPIADSGVGWDTDPWLLGVPNGVVELRNGDLRAGRQQDRISMQTTVAYDPNAQCPRWLQFIDEVFGSDEELKDWIHRALGYSTTGSTKEQVSFFCFGRGDNGKSTMIRTVRGVLGDYGATTPFSTLEAANRQSIPNDLAALAGRRFVTASEMNEGRRLNEARLKMLCGEDIVSARFLHREFFEFKPLMKLWLGVNHKPRVEDDSRGLWRKIRLIPFLQSFANRGDKGLEEKLLSESAGILTWLVQGALAWQERGLEPPKAVTIATEAYRLESDRLAEFIEGCCVTGAEFSVKANAIYKQYRDWADEQGLQKQEILSSTKFGTMMGERYDKRREGRGNVYVGIGLRDSGSPLRADREDKSADGLKPSSSGGRIDRSVDNGEDDERDHCFVAAMTVSFPEIALGPGRKIAAGEEVWTQFAQRSGLAAIRTAQAALDQLGREGQRRD